MASKIAYVITKANWGGAQRYVYDLAVAAKEHGHEVVVMVGGTGPLTENLGHAGVRVIPLPLRQHRSFLGDLFTFGPVFSLVRIIREERPDVLHVNSAKAGGLGTLAGRLARVPRIIFTAHGWEFNAPRSAHSRLGIRFFSWLTVLLSHETICVSDAVRRDIAWVPGTRKKLVVVHNGLVCAPLLSREAARAALAPHTVSRTWIGMMSELNPTKRVDDAVRAMRIIVDHHPEVILVIMGEGRERPTLEALIRRLKLRDRVFLAGFRSNAPALLNAFDLFVHASRSEALAYAILEAGCASLPVVATRVGGIPEIIPDDDHGLLVPPEDPTALANTLDTYLSDVPRAREAGARLHARVLSAFTKPAMIERTLALYR